MTIKIRVKPNSGKQEIVKIDDGKNDKYTVYLKSAPEKNKANAELVNLLRRYFNRAVEIKSGLTSRNKIIEIK